MKIADKLTDRREAGKDTVARRFKARGVKRGYIYDVTIPHGLILARSGPRPIDVSPFFTERNHNLHSSTQKSVRSKTIPLPCAIKRELRHKKEVIIMYAQY